MNCIYGLRISSSLSLQVLLLKFFDHLLTPILHHFVKLLTNIKVYPNKPKQPQARNTYSFVGERCNRNASLFWFLLLLLLFLKCFIINSHVQCSVQIKWKFIVKYSMVQLYSLYLLSIKLLKHFSPFLYMKNTQFPICICYNVHYTYNKYKKA